LFPCTAFLKPDAARIASNGTSFPVHPSNVKAPDISRCQCTSSPQTPASLSTTPPRATISTFLSLQHLSFALQSFPSRFFHFAHHNIFSIPQSDVLIP